MTTPTDDVDSWRDVDEALRSPMASTAISHSGQLNITNSTLFTTKFGVSVKSEMMSNLFAVCNCNASRLLAHMSPSSPVSVGILPLNRTLLVGTSHIDRIYTTSSQCNGRTVPIL